MRKLAQSFFISLIAFYMVVQFIPAVEYGDKNENLLLLSFTFALLAVFIKPFIKMILLPFNLVTFGFVGALVNWGIIFLLTFILPYFSLGSFNFPGYDLLGFMIPAFTSTPLITASILSIGVSFTTALIYYLMK